VPAYPQVSLRRQHRMLPHCYGTSGTVKCIAGMIAELLPRRDRLTGALTAFSRRELRRLVQALEGSTRDERKRMPGMKKQRVDGVVPGAVLLLELMRFFGVEHMAASNTGLREGIVAAYLRTYSDIAPMDRGSSDSSAGEGGQGQHVPAGPVHDGHVPVDMRPRCALPGPVECEGAEKRS
jgi:exopolyphosphatase/pppGpp-phosphohydrolase